MTSLRFRLLLPGLLCLPLALGACGGDDDKASSASDTAAASTVADTAAEDTAAPEEAAGEEPAADDTEMADDALIDAQAEITEILEATAENPAILCEHATDELLEQFGGAEACHDAAGGEEPDPVTIEDIRVDGETAVADIVEERDGPSTITFVNQDGGWLVLSVE